MDNNKISHRQLRRQIVLAYLSPVLLCLPGLAGIRGIKGIAGVSISLFLLLLVLLSLRPLSNTMCDLKKETGRFCGGIIGIFFLLYILFTAAYLLAVLMDILPRGILADIPSWLISVLAVIVCAAGSCRGIQRQGRLAEFTGGACIFLILILFALSLQDGKLEYLQIMKENSVVNWNELKRNSYLGLCFFSGLLLVPYALQYTENRSSSGRPIVTAIGIIFLYSILLLFLLPTVLGWKRSKIERYPMLPLLEGANVPGNVLARFDIVWILFILYGLLFSIATLFFYGSRIMESSRMGKNGWVLGGVSCFLSWNIIPNWDLEFFYTRYVAYIFLPGALLLYFLLLLGKKSTKGKHKLAHVSLLLLSFFLCGCSGVEPENRLYPLAIAVDMGEDGSYKVMYCMENMSSETGQDKSEEDGFEPVLLLKGDNFAEIKKAYELTQEKYLDLGHLEVIIFGKSVTEDKNYEEVLEYIQEQSVVGEDLYLFVTKDPEKVVTYEKAKQSSIGEYLKGIYENRINKRKGVTLHEVLGNWYENGELLSLPEILYAGGRLLFV